MIPSRKILIGDVRETIKEIADNSVHCVVTSPPYWNLRAYGDDSRELGRELTPWEFIDNMTAVFREIRRVLRPDGTCWMNMGDCYANDGKWGGETGGKQSYLDDNNRKRVGREKRVTGLKPKDLVMMPHRLAIALQDDGWWVRSDIIWHKPNPMPESVYDRPTKSHEYIFLLTKSPRYFYDFDAIREPVTGGAHARGDGVNPKAKWKTPDGWDTSKGDGGHGSFHRNGREKGKLPKAKQNESFSGAVNELVTSRNKRTVWTVPTAAFSDAHFATFPHDLARPCIMAGSSEGGCCADCASPKQRIVELGAPDLEHQRLCGGDINGEYHGEAKKDYSGSKAQNASETKARILEGMRKRTTVGWKKTCKCETVELKPCTVFDPFLGSGTSGEVAGELGRNFIGCELYEKFIPMIDRRTSEPGFML